METVEALRWRARQRLLNAEFGMRNAELCRAEAADLGAGGHSEENR